MNYTCPVCGYPFLECKPYEMWTPPEGITLEPPYRHQLGAASYEVCLLCGFEFGNDDDPGTVAAGDSFESYREQWQAEGSEPFEDREYFPEGFDPSQVVTPGETSPATSDDNAEFGPWIGIARSTSLELVSDAFMEWCAANNIDEPPTSTNEVRWHRGLGAEGDYWDVWVRRPASESVFEQEFSGHVTLEDGETIPVTVRARSSGEASAQLKAKYGLGNTISLSYDLGSKRQR